VTKEVPCYAVPNCPECTRLWNDSATFLLAYGTAVDALSLTLKRDQAYPRRTAELAEASRELFEAQRLEQLRQDSHHNH
jgi:hypothetical protein